MAEAKLKQAEAAIARVKALAADWAKLGPDDDWADTMSDTLIADCGKAILKALDQPKGALPASMLQPVTFHGEDDDRARAVALHPVDEREDEDQPGDQPKDTR